MPNVNETTDMQAIAIERLNWALNFSLGFIASLSDEQLTARAGGKGNHALWVLGHLAVTDDFIVATVTGKPPHFSKEISKLFGGGSEPSDNAADYPSRKELIDMRTSARQRLIQWVESLDESTLRKPMPQMLAPLAPDSITLPFALAAHDFFHTGQVASVRSSLDLPRLMM